MRPTFFHASLAAGLAAMSAPGIAGEEVYFKMTLTDASIATYSPSAGKGEQIDILSFSWGPRQSTSAIELEPARITSYQISGAGASSGGGANEMRMEDTAGREKMRPGGGGVGANETMTVGGARTEAGQATGKRQHKPLRTRMSYDKPLPQGSVRVKVKMPWLACRVGATYPRLELGGSGKRYVLQDVTVASCGRSSGDADDRPTEEVAFYYNKVG